jgi:hypothetical protein
VRAVVQRVSSARVVVDGEVVGEVGRGLCVLLGISREDGEGAAERLAGRVAKLRIFENEEGRFDRSPCAVAPRRIRIALVGVALLDLAVLPRGSAVPSARPAFAVDIPPIGGLG